MDKGYFWAKFSAPLLIAFLAVTYSFAAHFIVDVPFVSVLLASILIFTLIASNLRLIKNRKYAYIFIALMAVKLILLLLNAKYKVPFMAGVDWINYHNYAMDAISAGGGIATIFNNSLDFFVFLMALIYKVFGPNPEQIYFFIFPLSLLLVTYVHKTVLLITKKQESADKASMFMAFWPVDIIFSMALLREIPIQLMVIISFFHFIRHYFQKRGRDLLLAFVFIILAALMHSGMIGIFLVYLYALLQRKLYKKLKFVRIGALVFVSIAVLVISFTPIWASMSKRFGEASTETGVVTALENQNKYLGDAATNYISTAPQDLGGVISSVPYRFFMFAFAPLPWQVHDVGTVLSFVLDGALQIVILFTVWRIYKNKEAVSLQLRNVATLIMMCVVATYLIFSLGTSNYGTAIRHRAKVAPLVVVLIAAFEVKRRQKVIA
jgi:hypothetical protein